MDLHWNIRLIITNITMTIMCYCCSFISTKWVITRYQKELIKKTICLNTSVLENNISFEDILSSKTGFKLFADHLVKEFSIEHLFFLFEIMLIKNDLLATKLSAEFMCVLR